MNWSSSNTGIATVDANGKLTAKAAGNATITATAKDGSGKKATCAVTVTAPTVELRTQFLEDKTTVATFGNVIHYKYGTNHRGTANEFLIVPWDYNKNNYVQDADASHFSCSSSKTGNITVTVEDLGSRKAFCVKVVRNPYTNDSSQAYSDLTFSYTAEGGTKITKTTRVCIANSAASSAFSYKILAWLKLDGSRPDVNGGTHTHIRKEAGENTFLRLYPGFDASSENYPVCDTKDMASYSWSSSNSSVVEVQEGPDSEGGYPRADCYFKSIGTSNVKYTYIDYKGNKLDKTIKFTVKKSYFDTGEVYSCRSDYWCGPLRRQRSLHQRSAVRLHLDVQ